VKESISGPFLVSNRNAVVIEWFLDERAMMDNVDVPNDD
jgi:hypothetical protein